MFLIECGNFEHCGHRTLQYKIYDCGVQNLKKKTSDNECKTWENISTNNIILKATDEYD